MFGAGSKAYQMYMDSKSKSKELPITQVTKEEFIELLMGQGKTKEQAEMLVYMCTHDWEGDYDRSERFIEQAKTLLNSPPNTEKEEQGLLNALLNDPTTAPIYADWLEDHDRISEAATIRSTKYVKSINSKEEK